MCEKSNLNQTLKIEIVKNFDEATKNLNKSEIYELVLRSVYNAQSFLIDKLIEKGVKLTDREKDEILNDVRESIHKIFWD